MILLITAPNGFASASFEIQKNFWWKFDNSNCKITSALFSHFYRTQLEFYSLKTRNGLSKTNKQIRNVNPSCKNNKWQTTKEKIDIANWRSKGNYDFFECYFQKLNYPFVDVQITVICYYCYPKIGEER